MIKAVLVDIDNTLLDFDAYVREAMAEGFETFHLGTFDEQVYAVFRRINTELWHRIELGTLTYGELLKTRWNTVFEALGISFDGETFETYFKGRLYDNAILIDGAETLLRHLHDRYIVCAASNGPYGQQVNRLTIAGLLPYFHHLFISEEIGVSKPDPAFFEHCLAVAGVEPHEVMMIGDSVTSDMQGAVDSGIHTCYFDKHGTGLHSDLPIEHAVQSLEDILKIL